MLDKVFNKKRAKGKRLKTSGQSDAPLYFETAFHHHENVEIWHLLLYYLTYVLDFMFVILLVSKLRERFFLVLILAIF